MEIIDPNAQGQQTQAGTAADQTVTQSQESGSAGVEKRIADLTYRFHEAERKAEEQAQRFEQERQQYMTMIANQVLVPQQPQTQMPDMDPDERRKFEALIAPLNQKLAQMEKAHQAQSVYTAALQKQVPPDVAQIAANVAADWQKRGVSGWNYDDAIQHAELLKWKQEQKNAQVQTQATQNMRQNFNQAPPVMTQGGTVPNTAPQQKPALRGPEFDRLSPDQQELLLWQAFGNSDIPI